jgi:hypothetical protein
MVLEATLTQYEIEAELQEEQEEANVGENLKSGLQQHE